MKRPKRKKKSFFRTKKFKISVIVILFILALILKGEKLTVYMFLARVLDALGDVYTDDAINSDRG